MEDLKSIPAVKLRRMIFDVAQPELLRANNPSIDSIPAFVDLTNRQLTYIFLAFDFNTPLRTINPKDRKQTAAILAGYKMQKDGKRGDKNMRMVVAGEVDPVERGIESFRAIQGDQDRDTLDAFDHQMEQFRVALRSDPIGGTAQQIKADREIRLKIQKELVSLSRLRKDLIRELDIKELSEDQEDDNVKKLCTLDRVNQEIIDQMNKNHE